MAVKDQSMTSANQFLEILDNELSPLVDAERTVVARFSSSRGFTNRPRQSMIFVNFINLPRERFEEKRGGGAENENNRMMFKISGFDEEIDTGVDKVSIEHSVSTIDGPKRLRGKTASPDKIASYLARYINEVAGSCEPRLTHG